MTRWKRHGVWVLGAAGVALAFGCGQPSETVLVQMSSQGVAPAGVSSARVTFEELRVLVDVPGVGPQWQVLLSDEEGGRTIDLLALGNSPLVAERDVPRGRLLQFEISFDTDEPIEPGALPVAGPSLITLPLAVPAADSVRLGITWDLAQTVAVADGGVVLNPAASVGVLP